MKFLLTFLSLAAIPAANAQLALFSFDGTTETAVGSIYEFGNVAIGSASTVRFRARNNGNSAVTVSTLSVSGAGFSIASVNGSLPYSIAPANFLEFTVQLVPAIAATYNANLQVNGLGVILLATAVAPPQLTAVSGCTASNNAFDFGNVPVGSQHLCNFSLFNPGNQPMVISKLGVTGPFQFQQNPALPITLAPNQATTFTLEITPACGTASFTGSLTVNSQTFLLTGAAITAALPKPTITFDSSAFLSGQQHSLTLNLPSATPCAAAGNLNLAFTPMSGLADDKAIVFVKGATRSVPFSVAANSTQVAIGGQASAIFQTGTTAGTITFTITGISLAADPTTSITIAGAVIEIDTATASNQRAGDLDVVVTGFDNTYSAGPMSFTFFDTSGKQLGAAIVADFTAAFKTFFSGQTGGGSSFLMRVSFPVIGNQTQVGKVQATLTNTAGQAQTGALTFQ